MPQPRTFLTSAAIAALTLAAQANAVAGDLVTIGKVSPISRFFRIFGDPWVMLFAVFSAFWTLFYFAYRTGLSKSQQVPAAYVHKISMVLSFLSMSPLLWWIASSPNAKASIKLLLDYIGWSAFGIVLVVTIAFVYLCARRIFPPAQTAGP